MNSNSLPQSVPVQEVFVFQCIFSLTHEKDGLSMVKVFVQNHGFQQLPNVYCDFASQYPGESLFTTGSRGSRPKTVSDGSSTDDTRAIHPIEFCFVVATLI